MQLFEQNIAQVACRQDITAWKGVPGGCSERPSRESGIQFLGAGGFMLCGPFLRILFRNVMSDDTAADGANDGMVARIMSGYATHDSALEAAGGMCGSGCRESWSGSGGTHPDSSIDVHDYHWREILT